MCIKVFFKLLKIICKLSLNKYKLSKIITLVRFVTEYVFADYEQCWNCGNIFLLLKCCCKIKMIWFCGNVSATLFYVTNNKKLFQNTWGHLHFFPCAFNITYCIVNTRIKLQVALELIVVNYFWENLHRSIFTGSFIHIRKVLEKVSGPKIVVKFTAENLR